jgi:hypothetical protein
MSRTIRRGKGKGKKLPDKDNNDFWYKHDITPIRDSMNQSFREKEKQYFKKFKETKYNQKPKSRGGTQ